MLALLLHLIFKMRILILSKDPVIIKQIKTPEFSANQEFLVYSDNNDPLDVMSTVCSINPSILVADDDYMKPNTVHIMHSIRKVNPNTPIVFITSNTSVDLGRDISRLGIHYYAQKPLQENELTDSIQSLLKVQNITN